LPPGKEELRWVANSSTLICGERDAMLVDTFLTTEQSQTLLDWIVASGKNLYGLRADLAAIGIYVRLAEVEEVFGNPFGGQRQTVAYEGITHFGLRVDTSKAFGLPGGIFAASGLQIHGQGLSATALGNNVLTVSSIEAHPGTLLEQLWYEQSLLEDKLAVRVGQMRADLEFLSSSYASLFINSTFGWPGYAATDLPGGGPAPIPMGRWVSACRPNPRTAGRCSPPLSMAIHSEQTGRLPTHRAPPFASTTGCSPSGRSNTN
jgi:carbohydrate-selective porin OprB